MENRQAWRTLFSDDSKYQLYVVAQDDEIFGFAYSQPYRHMGEFDETMVVIFYLAPEAKGKGLGYRLHSRLFSALVEQYMYTIRHCLAERDVNLIAQCALDFW